VDGRVRVYEAQEGGGGKGTITLSFTFAGKRKIFFYICDVITSPEKEMGLYRLTYCNMCEYV
jgi:hypothetical protein